MKGCVTCIDVSELTQAGLATTNTSMGFGDWFFVPLLRDRSNCDRDMEQIDLSSISTSKKLGPVQGGVLERGALM